MKTQPQLIVLTAIALLAPFAAVGADKVAFVADQGIRGSAEDVLSLIDDENVDLVLIQGDLGYVEDSAEQWNDNLDMA
ncbi:MAG: hypothetical protein KTR32_01395, partial [Granulosicoccus sp.]|nr:hypothetical protein [Granulosicoccus sp.]